MFSNNNKTDHLVLNKRFEPAKWLNQIRDLNACWLWDCKQLWKLYKTTHIIKIHFIMVCNGYKTSLFWYFYLYFRGHSNAISDCCFTSDGRYLCTASWDKSLKIWDIKTGEFRCHEPLSLNQGHEGSVSSCVFSQDGELSSYQYVWRVWYLSMVSQYLCMSHNRWTTSDHSNHVSRLQFPR